jgi:hypothetical protein
MLLHSYRKTSLGPTKDKMEGGVHLLLELDFVCGRKKERRNIIL